MTDRLAALLQHYTLHTDVFHTGSFCGQISYEEPHGYLHLLHSGAYTAHSALHPPLHIDQPSLLLYPRRAKHLLITPDDGGADLICATVDLGSVSGNPLALALPGVIHIAFAAMPGMQATLALLIEESQNQLCGRRAALNRLGELLLIHVLRHLMNDQMASGGLLAGLADKQLAKAITAMHEQPAAAWTLEGLAHTAGMSRARFAARFRETVGSTPGAYLAAWRVNLACMLLQQGKPVALVAEKIGYGSATALARVFRASTGLSPAQWARQTSE